MCESTVNDEGADGNSDTQESVPHLHHVHRIYESDERHINNIESPAPPLLLLPSSVKASPPTSPSSSSSMLPYLKSPRGYYHHNYQTHDNDIVQQQQQQRDSLRLAELDHHGAVSYMATPVDQEGYDDTHMVFNDGDDGDDACLDQGRGIHSVEIEFYTIERDSKNKEYVCYHIKVKRRGSAWRVTKRFSQCYALNRALSSRFKSLLKKCRIRVPSFPRRLLFGNLNPNNINDRSIALNEWLNSWLEICQVIPQDDAHPIRQQLNEFLDLVVVAETPDNNKDAAAAAVVDSKPLAAN